MVVVARIVTGVLLLAHGLVHFLYLAPDVPEFSLDQSWLVPGLPAAWPALTIVSCLLSAVLLVLFWDIHLVVGLAIDLALLAVVVVRPPWAEQVIGAGG